MSLSRMQLAAALLEYDNIDAPPSRPPVSHRDSALFKPYQPRPLDSIPIEGASLARPIHSHRRQASSSSGQALSPRVRDGSFPASHTDDPTARPESHRPSRSARASGVFDPAALPAQLDTEVDLDRWGLPQHLLAPGEPDAPSSSIPDRALDTRGRRQLPPLRTVNTASIPRPVTSPLSDRVNSIHLDVLDGVAPANTAHGTDAHDEANEAIARARRIQAMYSDANHGGAARRMSRQSTAAAIPLPASPASTRMSFRPVSISGVDTGGRPQSSFSTNGNQATADHAVDETEEILSPNPFALPAPPVEMGSRFDPKTIDAQRKSIDLTRPLSRLSIGSADVLAATAAKPHLPRPDSSLTTERLQEYLSENRQLSRTESHPLQSPNPLAGRDFHQYEDIPSADEYGKPLRPPKYGPSRPIDRQSLLRPKTLIMPQPLTNAIRPPSPPRHVPDGYFLGEKPLPAGARSSILTTSDPRAQTNGRPGLPLSLSQKTFRSSLMVDGKREEEEYWVGGATEDGEVGVEYAGRGAVEGPLDRRPGKLFGKSLLDQLEARKMAMKSKQRTFTGDMRPAMMARDTPGVAAVDDDAEPGIMRSNTIKTRQPLLKIDSSGEIDLNPLNPNISPEKVRFGDGSNRISKSRSVFGVDQIWEKEMAKLKVIQEAEEQARAQKALEEEMLAAKKEKKGKKNKDKSRGKDRSRTSDIEMLDRRSLDRDPQPAQSGISPLPVVLDLPPRIAYSPERAPPPQIVDPVADTAVDIEEGHDLDLSNRGGGLRGGEYDDGELSGDEETPLKKDKAKQQGADATQSASPSRAEKGTTAQFVHDDRNDDDDSDSDGDVPLSQMIKPGSTRLKRLAQAQPNDASDSEEDVPLSKLRPVSQLPRPHQLPSFTSPTPALGLVNGGDDSEDDDVPLMLRKAKVRSPSASTRPAIDPDVEDDLPLGFKHADAVVRKNADLWRQTMASPMASNSHYGMPSMASMPNMAMAGMGMGHMSMPPMDPGYAWGYGSPWNMGLGYMPPSMPMQGWPPVSAPGMPQMPTMASGMADEGGFGLPLPATKNIDSWRQEVATQPVAASDRG